LLRFCIAPAKEVKPQNFEKRKIVPKICQNDTFFRVRYPQNNALGDASERPGFCPKSFPSAERRICELTLIVSSAGLVDPPFHRSVGLKAIE